MLKSSYDGPALRHCERGMLYAHTGRWDWSCSRAFSFCRTFSLSSSISYVTMS